MAYLTGGPAPALARARALPRAQAAATRQPAPPWCVRTIASDLSTSSSILNADATVRSAKLSYGCARRSSAPVHPPMHAMVSSVYTRGCFCATGLGPPGRERRAHIRLHLQGRRPLVRCHSGSPYRLSRPESLQIAGPLLLISTTCRDPL
jgi:hypothetical protein